MNCPICAWSPDNPDILFLFETAHWRVCLAPNQSLLGRCVIHLKRHASSLLELTDQEMLDFLGIIRKQEKAIKLAFDATMFNWSCYMNLSYRDLSPNPHVHWWAVPRYNHTVKIGNSEFADPNFGSPYPHERWQEVPLNIRKILVQNIKEALVQIK